MPCPRSRAPSAPARNRVVAGLVATGLLATLLTWSVATGGFPLAGVDAAVSDFTRDWADALGWPVAIAHVIGRLTAPLWSVLAAGALALWLLATGSRAAAGLLALSGIAGVATSQTVKTLVGRTRPPGAEDYVRDLDRSFPSGHAMEGIYLYSAAGLLLVHLGRTRGHAGIHRLGVLLIAVGPAIGLSRLVLGVHWPTDVMAGWAYGSVVLCAAALVLWAPLARGWASGRSARPTVPGEQTVPSVHDGSPTSGATPPEPPSAGATPDPPGP